METLTKVVAIGFGSWGAGDSSASALNRWAKEVGRQVTEYADPIKVEFRAVSDDCRIDGLFNMEAKRIVKLPSITLTLKERQVFWGGAEKMDEKLWPVTDEIYDLKESDIPG